MAAAGAGAMRRSRGSAQMALSMQGATGRASLSNLRMRSASGAALTATGRAFSFNWPEGTPRSEEHTSELQSLMRISYAVFCLKKKKPTKKTTIIQQYNNINKIYTNKIIT